MIIAQLSDPHVTVRGSDFDKLYHTAGKLKRAIDVVNKMAPQPDFIFLTGDLVNRGGTDEYTVLKKLIDRCEMPVYLGVGNHDDREALIKYFPDHNYLPKKGFIQYVIEQEGLRMIMLDTNIPGKPNGTLCKERLDWLDKTLKESPDIPTAIFMHHPPIKTGIIAMDKMGFLDADSFGEVVKDHKQINRIFCGHVHRSIQGNFHGIPVQICPSTSHKVLLHLLANEKLATTAEPPEILLHMWDKEVGFITHSCFTGNFPVLWALEEA